MSIREPICMMWVGKRQLPQQLIRRLRRVTINFHEKKATAGEALFDDTDTFIMDSKMFRKGTRIALIMGWVHEFIPVGPFIVKSYGMQFPDSGDPKFSLKFQDPSHKMNKKQKKKRHLGTPEMIIKKLALSHGLGYDIDTITGLEFTEDFPLIQANVSDAALMQRLAFRYGYVWGVEGQNLYFKKPADLEEEGVQEHDDVPVLSYRMNDFSLKSFMPDIKYSKGGKRKAKNELTESLDELGNEIEGSLGEFGKFLEGKADDIKEISPELGDLMSSLSGQEPDDEFEEYGESNDTVQTQSVVIDSASGFVEKITNWVSQQGSDEPNEESIPGSKSGAATPSTEEEAQRQAAGKIIAASEIITGKAIPTIASMRWRPRMGVILAGVGQRLSGKYRIKGALQEYTEDGFRTELDVAKRTFYPGPKDKDKISKESESQSMGQDPGASKPGKADTATGPPPKVEVWIDSAAGTAKKHVIDGQPDPEPGIQSISGGGYTDEWTPE